jgi:hypothetical protein
MASWPDHLPFANQKRFAIAYVEKKIGKNGGKK